MNTNPSNYYQLLGGALGNDPKAFQSFVDRFKAKYNVPQTDGFVWDKEIQLDYTYQQLQVENNIATLPVYMDAQAQALDKMNGEFKIGKNAIPTQKHRYGLDTRILREKMMMVQKFGSVAMNSEAKTAILDLLFDSTDKLLAGNQNALTHQRMQIVSNGKFVISADNNPRGIQGIEFNFGTTTLTANATTKRWWTAAEHTKANEGADADPIKEIKDQIKAFRKLGYPAMQVEMSQDLFDDMLTHSKVLTKIGYSLQPNASSDEGAASYAGNYSDEALKAFIEKLIGAPIKVYDTWARAEEFDPSTKSLKAKVVENFNAKNIAFVPQGTIGTIKSVQQLVFADDPTVRYAWFDGGRTLLSQRYDAATRATYVESEFAQLLVPNMPQYMANKTVTA